MAGEQGNFNEFNDSVGSGDMPEHALAHQGGTTELDIDTAYGHNRNVLGGVSINDDGSVLEDDSDEVSDLNTADIHAGGDGVDERVHGVDAGLYDDELEVDDDGPESGEPTRDGQGDTVCPQKHLGSHATRSLLSSETRYVGETPHLSEKAIGAQTTDRQQAIGGVQEDEEGHPHEDTQQEETRREYMRGKGFVVVNSTGHEVMEEAKNLPVKPLRSLGWSPPEEAIPSSVSLGRVTNGLVSRMQPLITPIESFKEKHDVSPEDTADSQFLAAEGFGDLDFTWYFSAGVATAIMEAGVEQGYITQEQQAAMTLGDWSDMIGSGWFSDTMHDMALTKGGVYVNFGKEISWYTSPGGFRQAMDSSEVSLDSGTDLFVFQSQYDAPTDTTRLTAGVSPAFKKELTRLKREAESPGCPIARHAGTIPEEVAEESLHVQRQVEGNILTLDPPRNGKVHFTQTHTPIDRGLHALAGLLDTYDKQFGTPLWTGEDRSLEHHQIPRTNVLQRNGNTPFVGAS